MQASRRPSPGLTSAQNCFASAAQALAFTTLTNSALQSSDRSLMCVLRQSLIWPPPACTPGHCALASFRQAPVTSTDDAMEDGSNSMAVRTRELVMATRVVMRTSYQATFTGLQMPRRSWAAFTVVVNASASIPSRTPAVLTDGGSGDTDTI